MLRELLRIFESDDPMHALSESFLEMLTLAREMTTSAGSLVLDGTTSESIRSGIYERDVQVNRLEHDIRRRIVAHLSLPGSSSDAAQSLLLMSLVKDVERIGDYAKNLSEIDDLNHPTIPDDENGRALRAIRGQVETAFDGAGDTFVTFDHERALGLIERCRGTAQQCDALVTRTSRSDYPASTTAALVLGARYYKRINGHLLNVLSSVVMPVHKVDYFDEDEIPEELKGGG